MGFQEVVEDLLYFVGCWAEGVGQECLVGGVPVTVYGRFDGQEFVGFYLGDEAKLGGGQGVGRQGG